MLVVGIDPGTATTGYGLVHEANDGTLVPVTYGAISTSPKLPLPERLLILHNELVELLALHHPDQAAVEKLFFQTNAKTAIAVGQARGVILLALAQAKIAIAEYTPLEVKQAVAGYGNAPKNQVQQMVRAILGLDELPRPDDAADALAVAICHIHSYRMREAYA